MPRKSSKQKVLEYFRAILKDVESRDIQAASGAVEWARRVENFVTRRATRYFHKDRADLKPNEYIMETTERLPAFKRDVSKETRAFVLERNGSTCQMCGMAAGDPDPFNSQRTIRLTIGHIIDKSKGGDDSAQNLRAVCMNCNEGLQNSSPPKPDRILLLAQVRRATIQDQEALLKWLLKKFNLEAHKKELRR